MERAHVISCVHTHILETALRGNILQYGYVPKNVRWGLRTAASPVMALSSLIRHGHPRGSGHRRRPGTGTTAATTARERRCAARDPHTRDRVPYRDHHIDSTQRYMACAWACTPTTAKTEVARVRRTGSVSTLEDSPQRPSRAMGMCCKSKPVLRVCVQVSFGNDLFCKPVDHCVDGYVAEAIQSSRACDAIR